jgi:competence protein ComEC
MWVVAEPWRWMAVGGDGRLRVTFLDVGQGDAALVRFPHGFTLLVDAGGLEGSTFDIGDRVVAPVLRHEGLKRLTAVAITHAHPDHVGGMASVVREFRPRSVWDGIPVPRLGLLADLRQTADAAGSVWWNLHAGDVAGIDGVRVHVHHPGLADWERQDVRNDDSLVLELVWRDVSIVLTGDIGVDVERELARRLDNAPIRVVKVPHHGSLTSSSRGWLEVLKPDVAVVSAGRGNPYGHPVPAVLDRYQDVGARVFRTDRDGAVTVETDGREVRVSSYRGREVRVSSPDHEGAR